MAEDLGNEHWNVVTSIGLSGNVEVLCCILGELLEEQGQESIDIFTSSDGIAHGFPAVRVADIDWLIEEDDGSVGVPRIRIVFRLYVLCDRGGTKFHEETCE